MNYLKNKNVYLAGPIHACKDDGIGWRNMITPFLEKFELDVVDPCKMTINGVGEVKDDKKKIIDLIKAGKFLEAKEQFYPIVRKDLRCVDRSDFIICVYDPTLHMCGTLHELVIAHQQRKPIFLYFDKKNIEKVNPWILTFVKASWIFTDWQEMLDQLKEIDAGHFDSSYWTIS